MDNKFPADIVIENAAQLLTCKLDASDHIGLVTMGSVAVSNGNITAVGNGADVAHLIGKETKVLDAAGKVVMPGFVDCHTHVVFGGTRVEEYCARLETDDLEELKRRGVPMGIMVTLSATRGLPTDELYEQSAQRVRKMILNGTTTLESKSGYSLNTEGEVRQLEIGHMIAENLPIDVSSTFLGAHGWPPDMEKEAYMELLINEMIPEIGAKGLAVACDIWCVEGLYEKEVCR